MTKLSKRDSLFLIVIAAVAIVGGIFWFYVKPARSDLGTAKQQAQESQQRVDQLQAELTRVTAAAKAPARHTIADELRLAKAYPYSTDIPITLLQLEAVAKSTHVELGEMTPATDTDYAGVTGTPFNVDVTGKFFDVQDFLYQVHNRVSISPSGRLTIKGRLFAITQANLSPENAASGDTATTQQKDAKVTATITVVAFSRTPGGGTSPSGDAAQQGSNTGGNPS